MEQLRRDEWHVRDVLEVRVLWLARLGTAEDHRLGTHVKHPALRIAREAAVEVLVARMLSMLPHLAERAQG